MGAAILTRFLAQAAQGSSIPHGLVLASPVIAVPGNPGWWRQLDLPLLLLPDAPRAASTSPSTPNASDEDDPPNWVTRDAAHRQWFETAPHRITSFTFRFFKNLFDLMSGCLDAAPRITVPVLVIYAANDVFIPPGQRREILRPARQPRKGTPLFPRVLSSPPPRSRQRSGLGTHRSLAPAAYRLISRRRLPRVVPTAKRAGQWRIRLRQKR